ncbi:MAG: MipA/OmpV family protein, partial [Verrucomicrobiia bacterium]
MKRYSFSLFAAVPRSTALGSLNAVGVGFSVTHFITARWLINADVAINRLFGSASESPVTQSSVQGVAEVTIAYR